MGGVPRLRAFLAPVGAGRGGGRPGPWFPPFPADQRAPGIGGSAAGRLCAGAWGASRVALPAGLLWELPEVQSVVLELFGAREGHHAPPAELSVVRRFYPRAVLDLPP